MKITIGQKIDGWKNYTPTQIKVVGLQHRYASVMEFFRGCQQSQASGHDAWVTLVREPHNKHDPNAIKVIGHWRRRGLFRIIEKQRHIGYLQADIASEAAPLVEAGQMRARLMSVYRSNDGFLDVNIILVIPH
ncbi:MAG: HIRAN domain-containing protein [Oceanicaulis sp.]|nr:HIRAN domain-containing protein [Oceanicaulis sp.]